MFIEYLSCAQPKTKYEGYNNKEERQVLYSFKAYHFLLKTHEMQLILNPCIVDFIFVIFLSVTVD